MERKKIKVIQGGRKGTEENHIGHTDHILSMAISSDDKFLVMSITQSIIKNMNKWHKIKGPHVSV